MPKRLRSQAALFTLVVAMAVTPAFDTLQANPAVGTLQAIPTFEVIASGLDNPRGLAFSPGGVLYIAEAGRGGNDPCIINSAAAFVCYGGSGAITTVVPSSPGSQVRFVTQLPSLAPPAGQPEEGRQALGPHKISFDANGQGWVTIGLGADPALRSDLAAAGPRFGRLLRFFPNGKTSYEADLAAYEAAANPDGGHVDSNPYGVKRLSESTVYTDAGGNALNEAKDDGTIRTLAVFPDRLVPFGPPGNQIPMQAVPTAVTRGPDGDLYVGQLTGFPFPINQAKVFRVPRDGGLPTIVADKFTNIIDLTFGPDNSLYVLEMFVHGLLSGNPTGRLTRIMPDGTRTTVASAGLILPGGVAIGADGLPYVTRFSTEPGVGDVVRIQP